MEKVIHAYWPTLFDNRVNSIKRVITFCGLTIMSIEGPKNLMNKGEAFGCYTLKNDSNCEECQKGHGMYLLARLK